MFCKNDSKSYREVLPGIGMKAVVYGERLINNSGVTLLNFFKMS